MDATDALRQAKVTVHEYLIDAIRSIDKLYYEGYAAENPILVAAYIKACAMDFDTWARTEKDKS